MKKHIISVGFYSVYRIELSADKYTEKEALKLVKAMYENEGIRAIKEIGQLCDFCTDETLIQYEGVMS